jgi:hypothetical protein
MPPQPGLQPSLQQHPVNQHHPPPSNANGHNRPSLATTNNPHQKLCIRHHHQPPLATCMFVEAVCVFPIACSGFPGWAEQEDGLRIVWILCNVAVFESTVEAGDKAVHLGNIFCFLTSHTWREVSPRATCGSDMMLLEHRLPICSLGAPAGCRCMGDLGLGG